MKLINLEKYSISEFGNRLIDRSEKFYKSYSEEENPDIEGIIDELLENINKGSDINEFDEYGNHILRDLMISKRENKFDLIKSLIERKADINIIDESEDNESIFHSMALNKKIPNDFIGYLIEKGAKLSYHNESDDYEIHIIYDLCSQNFFDRIRLFIDHKVDVNAVHDGKDASPLKEMSENVFDLESIKFILEFKKDNDEDLYLLHNMVTKTIINKENLELLLSKGENVNQNCKKSSVFHEIIIKQKVTNDILETIFKYGANPNIKNKEANTPFHYYCLCDDLNVEGVKLFLQNKADLNIQNNQLITPFIYYFSNEKNLSPQIIYLMLQNKASLDTVDENKNSVLHYLCDSNIINIDLIKVFENEIPKNLKNKDSHTPLELYCNNKIVNIEIIKFFVEKKANVLNEDERGKLIFF